ncbi:MAG: hypothetical protein ACRCVN_00040 [Spirochaetia bacterium]
MTRPCEFVCSIDIGTTSLKIGLFSAQGTLVSFKKIEYPRHSIDWQDLSFFSLFDQQDLDCIHTIAISAQSPSIVPILKNGRPGTPIFYYELEKNLPIDNPMSVFLPKVAYHKKAYLAEYLQTSKYVNLGDYLVYLLTGQMVTSLPQKLYESTVWTPQEILQYELDLDKFGPIVYWPELVGMTKIGLPCQPQVRVLASNYDFLSAILGLDAMHMNIATDRGGGSMGLNFFFTKEHLLHVQHECPLPQLKWSIYPHLKKDAFNAGLIFPDFDDFLSLIKKKLYIARNYTLEELLIPILNPLIEQKEVLDIPLTSPSFIQLWQQSTQTTDLKKVQDVFIQYAQILKLALQKWPLGPIKEVRASGGPNESAILTHFKAVKTGIPWKTSDVVYAELLGNFYATQMP